MTEPEQHYRPTTRLCIPLQTGNGFAMALFMWGFFWMPALVRRLHRASRAGCRVCGAPLPQLDQPVLRCAYCSAFNIVSCARPRAPSRVRDQVKALEETLEAQDTEQVVRWIFVGVVGVPAMWAAVTALRALWLRLS